MARLSTKQIALISAFATLIVIVTRLPGIPIVGGAGGGIEFSAILYPIVGVILGPWAGAVAVLLGNFIAWIIPKSSVFGLLMIPAGAIAALVTGSLSRKTGWCDWRLTAAILATLDVLWYLTPVGWEAPFYPVLHWIAFGLAAVFRGKINEFLISPSQRRVTFGVGLSVYMGTMAEHMTGNLIYISTIGLVIPLKAVRDAIKAIGMAWLTLGINIPTQTLGDLFMGMLLISAIERLSITVIATLIGAAVIRILQKGLLPIPSPLKAETKEGASTGNKTIQIV